MNNLFDCRVNKSLILRAIENLRAQRPKALASHSSVTVFDANRIGVGVVYVLLLDDFESGTQLRAIVLGKGIDSLILSSIQDDLLAEFERIRAGALVECGNTTRPYEPSMLNSQLATSPKIIIYSTNTLNDRESISNRFKASGLIAQYISEEEMYRSVFISFGGPDAPYATVINNFLRANGIRSWFFPTDAVPGQKLHRTMSDGVNDHDCVLLLCSESSLKRNGVLNELEQVLARESREAGASLIVPFALDDFVFGQWSPSQPDVARQIRDRVIGRLGPLENGHLNLEDAQKLLRVLRKDGY